MASTHSQHNIIWFVLYSKQAPIVSMSKDSIAMDSESEPLHMLFFPLMAHGHMNPMIDMAKLFASRGVKATILTTPANAPLIQPTIDRANESHHHPRPITLELIPFPSAAAGLPEGCENLSSLPSEEFQPNFLKAIAMLRQPFDQVLTELLPDCVVSDSYLPWTYKTAAEHGVPRLVFHGMCLFAQCAAKSILRHKTLKSLPPDAESFVIPGLPHRIEMLRSQMFDISKVDPVFIEIFKEITEWEPKSYGVLVNSFYELEPDYGELYRAATGLKAWHVGPVSLCNKDEADKCGRGNKASIDGDTCLQWLDGKSPGSVVYVCFGSMCDFTPAQLRPIPLGLEACNHPFILAVRNRGNDWLPEGYEERIGGRGLVIKGWAPQILILNHAAVGGFVTHCGWNSSLEGVSAGVPMVTWPLFGEQFYNERLIVDVLGIGVSVGVKEFAIRAEDRAVIEEGEIERAVVELMGGGEEAEGRRRRAKELGVMARRAVDDGGSSYVDMGNMLSDLLHFRNAPVSL